MALLHSPSIVTDGLVMYYDMNNIQKSFKGAPTTNLVVDSMSIYNNVPSDVTAALATTGEYYKSAPIYKLTLTPITSTGVGYLTAGNNPGIGVYSSSGGGIANRYTGHAIFYKPTITMHTTPLFTGYSNIVGWGAGTPGINRSVSMGDGWYRGEVIWYDTVTRSDAKFWAVNPATATLNVPIVTYFAGPFKEDRNDSTLVAPYVYSDRSSTQAILDLTNNNTITASNLTYISDGTFSFNGSSNYIDCGNLSYVNPSSTSISISLWIKTTTTTSPKIFSSKGDSTTAGYDMQIISSKVVVRVANGTIVQVTPTDGANVADNIWHQVVIVIIPGVSISRYVDGILNSSVTSITVSSISGSNLLIGKSQTGYYYSGQISAMQIYNRALTAAEVLQNFNALRGRYGI